MGSSFRWFLAVAISSALGAACSPAPRDFGSGGAGGEGSAQSSSSAMSGAGGSCAAPAMDCGGKCVDTSSDPANCGKCDSPCPMGSSCQTGSCTCPGGGLMCGAACVDVSANPQNCGACGHDCLGGACQGSMCQPITLAMGQNGPNDVVVGKAGVFWTAKSSGQVMALLTGNMVPTVLTGGQPNAGAIDLDQVNVYWTTILAPTGTIKKIATAGGNATTLVGSATAATDLKVNLTEVFWADFDGMGKGTLSKVPKAAGAVSTLLSGAINIRGIALDGGFVYFTNAFSPDFSVSKIPIGGGARTTLVSGLSLPWSIDVDMTSVYWTDPTAGTVQSVPINGGMPTTLAAKQPHPFSIAVDLKDVYWTDTVAGTVMKVSKGGGMPVTLAAGQMNPQGLALDATAIYWANNSGGTIMRLAK